MNLLYSGAAKGADSLFTRNAIMAGHQAVNFVFHKFTKNECTTRYPHTLKYLSFLELSQADDLLIKVNKNILKRKFPTNSWYVNNLLRRNYYQVKDTKKIYAIIKFKDGLIDGGTAWAVYMGIMLGVKEIYLFDMKTNKWYDQKQVEVVPPKPEGVYTGIGSRELTDQGIEAINNLYK